MKDSHVVGEMLKLLKALYGTKQAGRNLYLLLDSFLKGLGFTANKADHCFYTLIINDIDFVLLLLYVDDIIIYTCPVSGLDSCVVIIAANIC